MPGNNDARPSPAVFHGRARSHSPRLACWEARACSNMSAAVSSYFSPPVSLFAGNSLIWSSGKLSSKSRSSMLSVPRCGSEKEGSSSLFSQGKHTSGMCRIMGVSPFKETPS